MKTLLVASVLLLAGCLGPSMPAAPATTSEAPHTTLSFESPVVALETCAFANCYEPTIAADPQARLFVADGSTSAVAVSLDAGQTWTQRDPPPIPLGLSGDQSDVILQVSPTGRLYYSALVIVYPGGISGPLLEGIEVAWSDDGAKTWAGNVHVGPVSATPQVIAPDRQWLGFAPDGTIYLTYNQIPTGIWFANSGDEGKTWSGWTRAAPVEARGGGIGQSGPPVVDSHGRVYVAACAGPVTLPGPDATPGGTLVFRSDDKGVTFIATTVPVACNWFPILAVAPDDTLVLALQPDGVTVSLSADAGQSFTTQKPWGSSSADAAAWPVAGPGGRLDVAWFAVSGNSADVQVTHGSLLGGAMATATLGKVSGTGSPRTAARTDYASGALLPDGRLAVVWVAGKQAMVAVQSTPDVLQT